MLLTVVESKVKMARPAGAEHGMRIPSVAGAGLYSALSGGELRPFAAFLHATHANLRILMREVWEDLRDFSIDAR